MTEGSDQSDCTAECESRGTIRLLNNAYGFRRYCLEHASEVNGRDGWRDACGDLLRAREHERDCLMLRELSG